MQQFYFNLSGGGWEPDRVGTEFKSIEAARLEAIRFAGEVLKDEPERLARAELRVDVHNEDHTIRFAIVVRLQAE